MVTKKHVSANWKDTVKAVLFKPSKFFSKMPDKGGYSEPLKFAAINYGIGGLLMAMAALLGVDQTSLFIKSFGLSFPQPNYTLLSLATIPLWTIAGGIFGVFVLGGIYYALLRLLGGKGTYQKTVSVLSYGSVTYLFSWMFAVSMLIWLYQIYLQIIGFSATHKISKGRAAVAVILPTIVFVVLAVIFLVWAMSIAAANPALLS